MAAKPWRRFNARIDPPKSVQDRIAATITRQAVRTGLALRFFSDKRPVFKTRFFIIKVSFEQEELKEALVYSPRGLIPVHGTLVHGTLVHGTAVHGMSGLCGGL
jgi:hypothetical protein